MIVNNAYRHYSGELQIVREPIINDGKRNLIARLAPGEDMMLDLINANDLVEFYEFRDYQMLDLPGGSESRGLIYTQTRTTGSWDMARLRGTTLRSTRNLIRVMPA